MSQQPDAANDLALRAYGLQRANARVAVILARVMEAREPSSRRTATVLAKAARLTIPTALPAR